MYMVAHTYATAHPRPPPTTIPHQTPDEPNPNVKANRYAKKATKTTSLTRVSIKDVKPFPMAWKIELAVIPSGTVR